MLTVIIPTDESRVLQTRDHRSSVVRYYPVDILHTHEHCFRIFWKVLNTEIWLHHIEEGKLTVTSTSKPMCCIGLTELS